MPSPTVTNLRPANRLGTGRNGSRPLTARGYVRLSAAPYRGQYEHRVVMARLVAVRCFYVERDGTGILDRTGIPINFHVEHVDHDRAHNCHCNFLLLQDIIHNYCSGWTSTYRATAIRTAKEMGGEDWRKLCGVDVAADAITTIDDEVPF